MNTAALSAALACTAATLAPAQPVPTQSFEPQPIRIEADDLPPPFHTESARKAPRVVPIPDDQTLNVPAGFRVSIFADNLDNPRWLALTPDGHVLLAESRRNRIWRLVDADGDGIAEQRNIFADESHGLYIPFGMSFAENTATDVEGDYFFFLGNTDAVWRFPWQIGRESLVEGTGEKMVDLPGGGYNQHWTRNVILSPDASRLYVSVGSRSNVDEEDPPRAAVSYIDLNARPFTLETFAFGLRNPVGLDFEPHTGDLYTTVNERDGLGDDLVPDYLTRIRQDEFYGWPYAYLTPDNLDPRRTKGDRSERPDLAARTLMPDVLFQSHSAALGLAFYQSETPTFPQRYRHGAYVAFRGSWNRDAGTGYKIVFVPFDPQTHRPLGHYEDFLTGFLIDPQGPTTWGRPVGVLILPDGSLIFTEEPNGRIYRVSYEQPDFDVERPLD